jgi:hypothetical protein
LHCFEALPTPSGAAKVVGLLVRLSIVFLGDLFADNHSSMQAAIHKVMNDVRILVKRLRIISLVGELT